MNLLQRIVREVQILGTVLLQFCSVRCEVSPVRVVRARAKPLRDTLKLCDVSNSYYKDHNLYSHPAFTSPYHSFFTTYTRFQLSHASYYYAYIFKHRCCTSLYPKVSGLAAWSENCKCTVLCHWVQLYCYFVSQSSKSGRHNPLSCFWTSVYCCKRIFRYRLSPETFGYSLVYC
jgi:hypothetical protein